MLDESNEQQEQFEKVQDDVEYLRFEEKQIINSPAVGLNKIIGRKNTNDESVTFRFEKVHSNNLYSIKSSKHYAINKLKSSSYKSQQQQPTQQQNVSYSNLYENGISPLGSYYQNHPHAKLVYRKEKQIGTRWIGQREHWASVFASWQMIEKSQNRSFYCKQEDNDPQNPVNNNTPISNQIKFDSQFQSGNLFAVYKVGIFQYDLILQNDTNTKGNTQWFYFRMSNLPTNKNIKLNIVNLRKTQSLFSEGMLPCFYSSEHEKRTGQKWIRKGQEVKYFRNSHLVQGQGRKYYYTLSFIISTQYQNDTVKLAQSYPYTFGDLGQWLENLQKVNYRRNWMRKITILNKTLGGNKIQVFMIKQSNNQQSKILGKGNSTLLQQINNKQQRPLIIILARQHPGESPGSFMMQGIVEFLISKQKDAEYLRKNFEIIAIPMVNPDGVQAGNYRTNLLGVDTNRRWDCVTKQNILNSTNTKFKQCREQAYQIVYIKRFLNSVTKNRQIAYIIDLHGHSRKMNSFFYGNSYPQSPLETKMFPYICSRLSSMIKFEDCTFGLQEDKRSTARIQLFNMLKSPNIYTFEASFFGYAKKGQKRHFTIQNYKLLGQVIAKSMYICEKSKQSDIDGKQRVLWEKWRKQLRVLAQGSNENITNKYDQNGSDSQPEQFQIKQAQRQLLQQQFTQMYNNSLSSQQCKPTTASKRQRQETLTSSKQPIKSLRQMQVLDIAKINSVFPYDVLALVPNSFCVKIGSSTNVKDNKMKQKQKQITNNIKKVLVKDFSVQTQECRLIKVYQLALQAENNDTQTKLSTENVLEEQKQFVKTAQKIQKIHNKSELIARPKSKTFNSFNTNQSSLIQQTIKNLSTLSITRSKSIHQKQLFENAKHLNAIKKSTEIKKNFKKVFTEFQIGNIKGQSLGKVSIGNKNTQKVNKSVQTLITFCEKGISKSPQLQQIPSIMMQSTQSLQCTQKRSVPFEQQQALMKAPSSLLTTPTTKTKPFFHQSSGSTHHQKVSRSRIRQTSQNYWTIDSKNPHRNLQLGLANNTNKSYNPARNQFRKTTIISKNAFRNDIGYNSCQRGGNEHDKQLQNWRIKKKSLI